VITVRPAAERLRTNIGWLDSRHTFSFGEHWDPRYMGRKLPSFRRPKTVRLCCSISP